MTETIETIGKTHEVELPRDAIHVAVVQLVATRTLKPGERIDPDGTGHARGCGIVDPYLDALVQEGERFWMFMNPGSITSLRHDWTHPAFGETPEILASKEWLAKVAEQEGLSYQFLVSGAQEGIEYTANGVDCHVNTDDEFWHHVEVVTGQKFGQAHRENTYFSCSC